MGDCLTGIFHGKRSQEIFFLLLLLILFCSLTLFRKNASSWLVVYTKKMLFARWEKSYSRTTCSCSSIGLVPRAGWPKTAVMRDGVSLQPVAPLCGQVRIILIHMCVYVRNMYITNMYITDMYITVVECYWWDIIVIWLGCKILLQKWNSLKKCIDGLCHD